jgi:hypothetical protein
VRKGFFALLQRAEATGEIGGVTIFHGAPSISHRLFTDDFFFILIRHFLQQEHKTSVMQAMGISPESFNDKYLGLPIHMGCKTHVLVSEGPSLAENTGLEGKVPI